MVLVCTFNFYWMQRPWIYQL